MILRIADGMLWRAAAVSGAYDCMVADAGPPTSTRTADRSDPAAPAEEEELRADRDRHERETDREGRDGADS